MPDDDYDAKRNGELGYADAIACARHRYLTEQRDEAAKVCDKARLRWRCSPPGGFTARFGQYRKSMMALLDAEAALRKHENAMPAELLRAIRAGAT